MMYRIKIYNLDGYVIAQTQMEEYEAWLNMGIAENWWGQADFWKDADQCTPEEIARKIDERTDVVTPAIPAVNRIRYLISQDPDVWKWEEDCTPQEIEDAIDVESVEISPEIPAVVKLVYHIGATYTIEIIDITAEIEAEAARQLLLSQMTSRISDLSQFSELSDGETKELALKIAKVLVGRNKLT